MVSNESDEFWSLVRIDADKWLNSEQGKIFVKKFPGLEEERKQKRFRERVFDVNYGVMDDFFILFESKLIDSRKVIYILKKDGLRYITKEENKKMFFLLFFDNPINMKEKAIILNLLSKEIGVELKLSERIIISSKYINTQTDLDWVPYFLFKDYFKTEEFIIENESPWLVTLPCNKLETKALAGQGLVYSVTKSDKRIDIWT
jgi:hypothetical protein